MQTLQGTRMWQRMCRSGRGNPRPQPRCVERAQAQDSNRTSGKAHPEQNKRNVEEGDKDEGGDEDEDDDEDEDEDEDEAEDADADEDEDEDEDADQDEGKAEDEDEDKDEEKQQKKTSIWGREQGQDRAAPLDVGRAQTEDSTWTTHRTRWADATALQAYHPNSATNGQ